MMTNISQISVFLANEPGQLTRVTSILSRAGVNLRAFTITESGDFGIIRLIADDPGRAHETLNEQGLTASQTEVIGIRILDSPGELDRVTRALSDEMININYAYVGVAGDGDVLLILKLDNAGRATEVLGSLGIKVLSQADLK